MIKIVTERKWEFTYNLINSLHKLSVINSYLVILCEYSLGKHIRIRKRPTTCEKVVEYKLNIGRKTVNDT